jgi:cell wall-associated NlpC family hydrolase
MLKFHHPRSLTCRLALVAGLALGLTGSPAVQAAPDAASPAPAAAPSGDPIMGLLGERGLLKPLGASMAAVQSFRASVRDTASDLVMSAMNFLGVPYKRGGNTEESGFDCSGFTRHIFENSIGLVLPRRADEQAHANGLMAINRGELKPGDLVFFNTMKRTFSHVGIYIGDDKFIHAPRTGSEVRIEDMRESYWARRFTGARRADLSAATPQINPPR